MFLQEKTDSDLKEKRLVTLEEFWDWYPDGYQGRFELHNGVILLWFHSSKLTPRAANF